jgi:RNA polymerase sigma-70 factor, ECF subfamily
MWQVRRRAAPGADGEESVRTAREVRAAYDRYGGELFGFLLRALDDRRLAEEAVRETFVRAWRAGRRFDPARSTLRTWLFAIARNGVRSARRRTGRTVWLPGPGRRSGGPDAYDRLLIGIQLDEALRRLGPEHREAVVRVHRDGLTCAQLAREAGVPVAVARARLYYGTRALRLVLEEHGWLV